MPQDLGLWQIVDRAPRRLVRGTVNLEKDLENWIERDPGLVRNGLTIVGRQMQTEGGPLDLLALDPLGRWTVIEIKRKKLYRDAIVQAIDYAACISRMPLPELAHHVDKYLAGRPDPEARSLSELLELRTGGAEQEEDARDVDIMAVGVGRDPGLERVVEYLSQFGSIPITVVSFRVFDLRDGQAVLARELTETDQPKIPSARAFACEDVLAQASASGVGSQFRLIYDAATRGGLHARPWKRSIMFTPKQNHSRCLFTVWVPPADSAHLRLWVTADVFLSFLGIGVDDVVQAFGGEGWVELPVEGVQRFTDRLERLVENAHGGGSDA